MMTQHKAEFDAFKPIHDAFALNPEKNKTEFNKVGSDIVDIIRDFERRLCGHSEKGQYGKFSANLSQKFWDLVRKDFPKIDFVGIR